MNVGHQTEARPVTSDASASINTRLLPGIGAMIGVTVAFLIASTGGRGDFWDTLHAAFVGYLQRAGSIAGLAVPIGSLTGFLVLLAMGKKQASSEPRKAARLVLSVWLSVAPALHWFAALFLFLYASRYTPEGGKIIPILFAMLHVLLLGLSITAAVCLMRRLAPTRVIMFSYLGLLMVGLLLPAELPVGYLHLMPFLFWLPKALIVTVAVILYALLALSVARIPKIALKPGLALDKSVVAESLGLFLAALALAAYFLTSQFDTRPTTPLTHSVLLLLAGSFLIAATLIERGRSTAARMLLRAIAPGLLILELMILVVLHHGDEADPITLMAIVMGMVTVLTPLAAMVPFPKPPEDA